MSRPLLYVAYPMRLDLGAANAIQTYTTVRELRKLVPGMRLVIPRWFRQPSAFSDLDALHLPRPGVNKLSKFVPWAGWSYIERTLYSFMLVALLVAWRVTGRGYRVIYVRDTVCAAWLALFAPLHGSRLIYEVHDLEASHPSKASKWPRRFWMWFLPWLDRVALGNARKVVSLTETFKEWAVGKKIRKAADIVVIPDAFDPDLYYPMDRDETRKQLGLPQSAFIVGYAGLTFAYRRLDLLLEAFVPLAAADRDAMLVLVGGRPSEIAELKEQAASLGLRGEQLVLPGQMTQERAALYINAADVLVIPDTVTGMTASPLKLFEYMAVGKPLVCKDMPALREIVDGCASLFFEEGSAKSLGDAIRLLETQPELQRQMGHAALEQSVGYTYRARAERIVEVVRSCR
ncbi:MAG: glycosyltransferase [Chloroflexota bacterium]